MGCFDWEAKPPILSSYASEEHIALNLNASGQHIKLHVHLNCIPIFIPYLLNVRVSAIAHHHTPKMDLSVIFSTPKSGKIIA